MDVTMEGVENENSSLTEGLMDLEAANVSLAEKVSGLEKKLEREKKVHRKFSEDVIDSERVRAADFKKEKQELVEEIKSLRQHNRQLITDVLFYQKGLKS